MIKALSEIKGFDEYLNVFGGVLGKKADQSLSPLHIPDVHPLPDFARYKLRPYPAQAHLVEAGRKAFDKHAAMFIVGECGVGKAQPITSHVLTPTGWVAIGGIQPGDEVIDPTGGTAQVVNVFPQGVQPVFRVRFQDGSSARCTGDHLWRVFNHNDQRYGSGWKVKSLSEIASCGLLSAGRNWKNYIQLTKPVEFRPRRLPLKPYLVGALIGDGGLMGLGSHDKFIPHDYLLGSVSDRVDLLQGLMDTDGSACHSCGAEYPTASKQLAEDVQSLVRSLGGQASIAKRSTKCTYKGVTKSFPSYRLHCRFPAGINPFRLPAKADAYRVSTVNQRRAIVSIEPDGQEECQCIMLDSSSNLYVTDDYVVTHNTIISELAIHEHASMSTNKGGHNGKYRAIVICPNHLIGKWCREVNRTIPGAIVRRFGGDTEDDADDDRPKHAWKDFLRMMDFNVVRRMPGGFQHEMANGARWTKPAGPEWYIVGRNQIKFYPNKRGLGDKHTGFDGKPEEDKPVRHAVTAKTVKKDDQGRTVYDANGDIVYLRHIEHMPLCPSCGGKVLDKKDPVSWVMLHKKNAKLHVCKNTYLEEVVEVDMSHNRKGPQVSGIDRIYFDSSIAREQGFMRHADSKVGNVVRGAGKSWVIKECGEQLWQFSRTPYRWAMAHIIQRKMRKFFNYLVVDECHEVSDSDSIQAKAFGKVWAATDKMFCLTGTFINGYSSSLYSLLMRICPSQLRERGFEWGDVMDFVEEYGRIDTEMTSKQPLETINQKDTGRTVQVGKVGINKKIAPGVMPTLFGHIVMPIAMFITLDELADHLPNLTEVLDEGCVELPSDIKAEYERIEATLARKIAAMGFGKGMKLMGTMLQTLLAYPDHPYGFEPMFPETEAIGYWEQPVGDHPELMTKENWRGVVTPWSFDLTNRVLPKEQHLIDICNRHIPKGHRVWVYVQSTRKYNVMPRLQELITKAGFKCGILNPADAKTTEREEWVRKNGDKYDVILSHPKLVSTGLDLFMRIDEDADADFKEARYKFNYNVLDFFQTGYNLNDMRQASRRSWRLGQEWDCFVYYQYYQDTMQHRAMELASRKLEAAFQLEGSFSEQGLAAMSNDSSAQMALCKSLNDKIDPEDVHRRWPKINARAKRTPEQDPEQEETEWGNESDNGEYTEMEETFSDPVVTPGTFVMINSKGIEFVCRIVRGNAPQPYIEATPSGVTPVPPPSILTIGDVRVNGWRLDVGRLDDETMIDLRRCGFVFNSATGSQSDSREVGKKHIEVGEVPFQTGIPVPNIKSPLDALSMEKQLVAETVLTYGLDELLPEDPLTMDEWDDILCPPKAETKTRRAKISDMFDSLLDEPQESDDDWDF